MPITTVVKKKQYYIGLNNGSSTTGAVRVKNINLASFVSKTADDTKAMAIMSAISDCLAKSVYQTTSVVTSQLLS